MERLFKTSNYKKEISLCDMWDFVLDKDDLGIEEKWFLNFPEDTRSMTVPSCWNTEPDLFRYEGTAWYQTRFYSESPDLYISFEAVQNEADVYLDGIHLGNHYGGFLKFGFEANNLNPGLHTLTVRVNNTINNIDTFPLTGVDWYNYGGIARPVHIAELSDRWIKNHKISYDFKNGLSDVCLSVEAEIKTFGEVSDELKIYVNDIEYHSEKLTVNGIQKICLAFDLSDIKLWDVDSPNLYYVRISFGNEDVIERIGFRKIETKGRDILLNGKKIRLLGINRHEEHPDWGFSMPFSLIKKDIDIIRNLNCNAIRTSHYPNSQKTADYCDEIGMLFWSEIPGWGRSEEAMTNDLALKRALSMEKEMIEENFHHPSIIVFCMHNECCTESVGGFEVTKKMIELAKSMDSSRLMTYVTHNVGTKEGEDIELCYSLADIVCLNHYIGWYFDTANGDWNEFLESYNVILKQCDSIEKPFIMSEFGFAALLGSAGFESYRWSEDYQADAHEFTLNQLLGNERIAGTYIWQFNNNRSAAENEISRPRGYNNKGIVDEYRKPKRAYRTIQKIYGEHNPVKREEYKTIFYAYKRK
ncbi:MAG: beta-glucuronidase [Clostridia bacterium]|nr:beta-glucuronidase [Clostridia bacterium]